MELPVKLHEKVVGNCKLEEMGLYWKITCSCELVSDKVERLYVKQKKLGVLEKVDDRLVLERMLSKSSTPELPPDRGYLTLYPETEEEIKKQEPKFWEGEIMGQHLRAQTDGQYLLFAYEPSQPCPCEPLMCFFEVKDGFWRLPINVCVQETEADEEEKETTEE